MILSRALTKDLLKGILVVIFILLLLFMSNKFVSLVQKAALGLMPPSVIAKMLLLMVPESIVLLAPLSALLASVFIFSGWLSRNEWTAAQVSGFSPAHALKVLLFIYGLIAALLVVFNLWGMPHIQFFKEQVLAEGQQDFFTDLKEETFYHHPDFPFVVYAKEKSGNEFKEIVLLQIPNKDVSTHGFETTVAKHAEMTTNEAHHLSIVLKDGRHYVGVPGQRNFRITEFKTYLRHFKIPLPEIPELRRTTKTTALIQSRDNGDKAELSFRIALPFAVIVMGLLGFPLSQTLPRQGYFVKVLPCLIVFLCYMNFISASRKWIENGLSVWIGGSVVHLVTIVLFVYLYRRHFRLRFFLRPQKQ